MQSKYIRFGNMILNYNEKKIQALSITDENVMFEEIVVIIDFVFPNNYCFIFCHFVLYLLNFNF